MKKTIKLLDKGTQQVVAFTISDEPVTSNFLLENSIRGYISCVKAGKPFEPEPQLTRESALSMTKTALPSKYTTTVRS